MEDMLHDQMEEEAKSRLEALKQTIDSTLSGSSKGGLGMGNFPSVHDGLGDNCEDPHCQVVGCGDPKFSQNTRGLPSSGFSAPQPNRLAFHKLRDFKIVGGTIGDVKGLEFSSLCYQIQM